MNRLRGKLRLLVALLALASAGYVFAGQASGQTEEKLALVVHEFTVASGVQWPYDLKQLQMATLAELKAKCGTRAEVVTETSENPTKLLMLEGETLSWNAGNRATRIIIGLGAGRESAKIHFYLNDASGKKCLSIPIPSGNRYGVVVIPRQWASSCNRLQTRLPTAFPRVRFSERLNLRSSVVRGFASPHRIPR